MKVVKLEKLWYAFCGDKMKKYGLITVLLLILVFACGLAFVAWNMDETGMHAEYTTVNGQIMNKEEETVPIQLQEDKASLEEEIYPDEFIVCIDPGHGGNDPGSYGGGAYEKEQVLELALMVREYLEKENVKVIMTRTRDCTNTLDERVAFANENHADVMVALHRNFYEGWITTNGIECWINSGRPQPCVDLAEFIMNRLELAGGMDIRGIRSGSADNPDEDFRINRDCQMPSIILEMGYMSDKSDNAAFENNKEKYAQAIALGIMDFMEKYGEESLNG